MILSIQYLKYNKKFRNDRTIKKIRNKGEYTGNIENKKTLII